MTSVPSFLRPSRLNLPGFTRASVVLAGGAMSVSRFGMDSHSFAAAVPFAATAILAFALPGDTRSRVGRAGVLLTVVVSAVFCIVWYLAIDGTIDLRSGSTGGVVYGEFPSIGLEALLAASLVAVVRPPRARSETIVGGDARATAFGLWLMAAGATGMSCAREGRPGSLHSENWVSDASDVVCVQREYVDDLVDCRLAVPLRPAAELAGAAVLFIGVAAVAHAAGRRARRWAWMRRARLGAIAGVEVAQVGTRVVFGVPGAGDGYRETARPVPATVVVAHEAGESRPVLALGVHVVAGAIGVSIAFACGFIHAMVQEQRGTTRATATCPRYRDPRIETVDLEWTPRIGGAHARLTPLSSRSWTRLVVARGADHPGAPISSKVSGAPGEHPE